MSSIRREGLPMGPWRCRDGFHAAALALLVVIAGCGAPRNAIEVLYVGNSFTYFNNMPKMVEEISRAMDGPIVIGTVQAYGGFTLRGHLEGGYLSGLISQGPAQGTDWDWVVLQEQSTLGHQYDASLGVLGGPDAFHNATRELVRMIRAEGAVPMLYMTWAKEAFPSQAETLSEAYHLIGGELGVAVAGVGEAWAEVSRVRPEFELYLDDGSHPNAAGSYLAACVLYAALTGRSSLGAPRELNDARRNTLVSLSAADAEFLQKIAEGAVAARTDRRDE